MYRYTYPEYVFVFFFAIVGAIYIRGTWYGVSANLPYDILYEKYSPNPTPSSENSQRAKSLRALVGANETKTRNFGVNIQMYCIVAPSIELLIVEL